MEEWLRARLLASAGVAALTGTRVDWGARTQGEELPAIVLHLISDIPELKMAGVSGWSDARVQVDCIGRTASSALLTRRAVVVALQAARATSGGKKYRVFVIDGDSRPDTDSAGIVHRARADVRVHYQL